MKKVLVIALVVAVAAVFINDVGKFTRARYNLSTATESVVNDISQYALRKTRSDAAVRVAQYAREQGVEVYQYDQNGQGVQVWTRLAVGGTWVIGPFEAWKAGKPAGSTFYVYGYGSSVYQ